MYLELCYLEDTDAAPWLDIIRTQGDLAAMDALVADNETDEEHPDHVYEQPDRDETDGDTVVEDGEYLMVYNDRFVSLYRRL